MLTLGPWHHSREFFAAQPDWIDLGRIRTAGRSAHPGLQLFNVVPSLSFFDPLVYFGARNLPPVHLAFHTDNRVTNLGQRPELRARRLALRFTGEPSSSHDDFGRLVGIWSDLDETLAGVQGSSVNICFSDVETQRVVRASRTHPSGNGGDQL